ncbi:MAG TPA: hypothetical protein DGD08_08560 [Gemmatimonas aurantiaca]|uniref:Uncharacterized protein n=2 Tax=Gemmatimonas aurantiaca TaxID=173480 RepID=C1A440_GEMAT|nr:hypothetical protein [Gemmatimonas aurantiaca]BAH38865.1 hypothetical protein GAU_1823 [Gemmatimonas aurantiaca T-27]HCT57250.1 hypothetical protein [Gemmatimonas aurantiaca]
MAEFVQRPITVDAEQFVDEKKLPDGVLSESTQRWLYSVGGLRPINKGQWIVRHPDRLHDILDDAEFQRCYATTQAKSASKKSE